MTKIQSQSEDYFWSVQRKIHIDLSKTEVWKIISSERNLDKFHPFCKTNEVISWDGNNFIDRIEYYNGRKLERNFTQWLEGEGYDLVIGDSQGNDSLVSWRLEGDDSTSLLSINVKTYIFNKGNKIIKIIPFFLYTKPKLISYLDSVLNGLKYYSETNKIVSQNQFGSHSWFS